MKAQPTIGCAFFTFADLLPMSVFAAPNKLMDVRQQMKVLLRQHCNRQLLRFKQKNAGNETEIVLCNISILMN